MVNLFPAPRKPDHLELPPLGVEKPFGSGEAGWFQLGMGVLFLLLVAAYFDLQVTNADFYAKQAESNKVRQFPIPGGRGRILDRDGRVIVDNLSSYRLLLNRDILRDEHLPLICQGLDLDVEEVRKKLDRMKRRAKHEPMVLKENISPGDIAFVEANRNRDTFPELEIVQSQRRLYPKNNFLAHVLGYVGEASEAELSQQEFARLRSGDIIGKTGVERYHNESLGGRDGYRRSLVNNRGRELTLIEQTPPKPGSDLTLSIDLDVQAVAEMALTGKRGSVVALDPRTGEVLAMASNPSFDPNQFTSGISAAAWKEIQDNPETPMLNRAIQAQLAPGSTFKPLVALAGLEEGVIGPDFGVTCTGRYYFVDRPFKCHSVHGRIQLHNALAYSCDVFFYTVGVALGIEKLSYWGETAGLGRKTGIDLPGEQTGDMPSSAWKMRKVREKWLAGDTVSVAIGQGYLTVTPLQLAHAIGGIVTGGVWQIPHLEKGQASTKRPPRAAKVSLDNVQKVVNGMCGVVQHGTATVARIPGVELCGKTGTSQLISNETLELRGLKGKVVDNAWFVGFAPRNNAEIVVVALYEAGLHGDRASLLVRDVTKAYFDKKQRRNVPVTLNPAPEDPHGAHDHAPGEGPAAAPAKPASAGAEL